MESPADSENQNIGPGWGPSIFDTFDEAKIYADHYLNMYAGIVIPLNIPVDYSGYGDFIEIREV